jgi:hypothetical protein
MSPSNQSAVASDARVNFVMIADIPESYTAIPGLNQMVTYNKTFDIKASHFEQYKERTLTSDPVPPYSWTINASEITAEIPEPSTDVKVWPPYLEARGWDHWILTVTLPDGKIIDTERHTR